MLKKTNMTTQEQIDIELILEEASAYGLRFEVAEAAQNFIDGGIHPLDAHQFAYEDWIKT